MIPELEKALNTCNVDKLAAILAHDPSLINALNDKGVPYAFVGAMQGNLALTRYIVEYTMASMNTRDADYRGILHYAVMSGKADTIPYLVERVGMSAFDGDRNLITPYDLAHQNQYKEIEEYFCAHYQVRYEDIYHVRACTLTHPLSVWVRIIIWLTPRLSFSHVFPSRTPEI